MSNYIKITTLKDYYKSKIQLLKDFNIRVTPAMRSDLKACTTEIQLDNKVKSIIRGSWI